MEELDGLLNLIDLAGSERIANSQTKVDRLNQTCQINKNLSALRDVISVLAKKEKHISIRYSKLSHLLQDSLGGNCKTLMYVNISHGVQNISESLISLQFATKVKHCALGKVQKTLNRY